MRSNEFKLVTFTFHTASTCHARPLRRIDRERAIDLGLDLPRQRELRARPLAQRLPAERDRQPDVRHDAVGASARTASRACATALAHVMRCSSPFCVSPSSDSARDSRHSAVTFAGAAATASA